MTIEQVSKQETPRVYSYRNFPQTLPVHFTKELSPLLFGGTEDKTRITTIADYPFKISRDHFNQLYLLTSKIVSYIDNYNPGGKGSILGIDPFWQANTTTLDSYQPARLEYGGLDIYWDPILGPKVLEINSRPQAMGLQDARMQYLGIENQPTAIDQMVYRFAQEGYLNIAVLGSNKNPFWRGHERIAALLRKTGFIATFTDCAGITDSRLEPDAILRMSSSDYLLKSDDAKYVRELIVKKGTPVINGLSSTVYGTRGFLAEISKEFPDLFPAQIVLNVTNEDQLCKFPWIKLETSSGFTHVVNFAELHRWEKNALINLINNNQQEFKSSLFDKRNYHAIQLQEISKALMNKSQEEIKWIAQAHLQPKTVELPLNGQPQTLSLLHRVYWVKNKSGKINISLEGFGATREQLGQSKGKINAGTGISVPFIVR